MSGIFIEPSDFFEVKVVVVKKNDKVYAATDTKLLISENEEIESSDLDSVEEYEATFREPSYKDEVDMFSNGLFGDISDINNIQLNLAVVNYNRLICLIKSWSFKDGKGEPISPNKENISKIHPSIARVLLDEIAKRI